MINVTRGEFIENIRKRAAFLHNIGAYPYRKKKRKKAKSFRFGHMTNKDRELARDYNIDDDDE